LVSDRNSQSLPGAALRVEGPVMSPGKERALVFVSQFLIVAAALLAWQVAAPLGWTDPDTLPPLSAVLATIWQLLQQPDFLLDLRLTAMEVVVAFLVMVPTGLLLGFIVGERRNLYRALRTPLDLLMATPKALFLPIFVFIFGLGLIEKVFFSLTLGIFVIILGGIAAVHSIPQGLVTAARSMGATRAQIYTRIYLPGMIPLILGSVRLGMIFTIFGVLVAEMYGASHGLGRRIMEASDSYHLKEMLAGVLLVMVVSIVLSELLRRFERASLRRRGSLS
jgi:ABC-type nitrate/sulfonate/bicarbonate transport system permease component